MIEDSRMMWTSRKRRSRDASLRWRARCKGTISDRFAFQFQDAKSGEVAAGLWASQRIREPAASEEARTEKDMSLGQDFA